MLLFDFTFGGDLSMIKIIESEIRSPLKKGTETDDLPEFVRSRPAMASE